MTKWSPEDSRRLMDLWNMGLSASVIALRFPDRSRCAVLGRLHRLRRHMVLAVYLHRPIAVKNSHFTRRPRRLA